MDIPRFVKYFDTERSEPMAPAVPSAPWTYCFFIGWPQHSLGTADVLSHFSHL
jgi:hypothetical protein